MTLVVVADTEEEEQELHGEITHKAEWLQRFGLQQDPLLAPAEASKEEDAGADADEGEDEGEDEEEEEAKPGQDQEHFVVLRSALPRAEAALSAPTGPRRAASPRLAAELVEALLDVPDDLLEAAQARASQEGGTTAMPDELVVVTAASHPELCRCLRAFFNEQEAEEAAAFAEAAEEEDAAARAREL